MVEGMGAGGCNDAPLVSPARPLAVSAPLVTPKGGGMQWLGETPESCQGALVLCWGCPGTT